MKQAKSVGTEKLLTKVLTRVQKVSEKDREAIKKIVSSAWIKTAAFIKSKDVFDFMMFSANIGGQEAIDRLGIGITFDLKNKIFLQHFKKSANLLLKSLDHAGIDTFTG
ncbi:MAG: hypothetical protein ACTSQ8_22495, partial [Candidatus Helarchaeota archaeon]